MWKRALLAPKVWAQLLTQNPALSPLSRHPFTPLTTSQLSRRETGGTCCRSLCLREGALRTNYGRAQTGCWE